MASYWEKAVAPMTHKQNMARIDELLKHLLNGTCCLLGNEQTHAQREYQQVKSWIMDEIRSEQETQPAASLQQRHLRIETLLREGQQELDSSSGDAFRGTLRELIQALSEGVR